MVERRQEELIDIHEEYNKLRERIEGISSVTDIFGFNDKFRAATELSSGSNWDLELPEASARYPRSAGHISGRREKPHNKEEICQTNRSEISRVRMSHDSIMKAVTKHVITFTGFAGPRVAGEILDFLNTCRMVHTNYVKAEGEEFFIEILTTKLAGHAVSHIQYNDIKTFKEFEREIIKTYQPIVSLEDARYELAHLDQGKDDLHEYFVKVQHALGKVQQIAKQKYEGMDLTSMNSDGYVLELVMLWKWLRFGKMVMLWNLVML